MKKQFWLGLLLGIGLPMAASAVDPLAPTLGTTGSATTEPGWQLGPVDVHPGIAAGVTYDSNITLAQTNRQSDYIGTISPSVAAVMGNREQGGGTWLSLSYRPTFLFFADHTNNDTIEHAANLSASWAGAKLTLGLSQDYQQTRGGVIEIGQRVRQVLYNTDVLARYALSEKTFIDVGPRLTIQDTGSFQETRDWGVDVFLNHQFGSKLTGGLGGSAGYYTATQSPNQWYERGLARVTYALATKIDVTASAGVEVREYDGDRANTLRPVFGLAGTYHPFDMTTLTVEGHRREEASVSLIGQNYVNTGVSGELRQQLWGRYYVGAAGGYEHRQYTATQTGVVVSRTDNTYLIRFSAGATIARRWTVSVYCQHQGNASSAAGHNFIDNQAGFQGSWGL